MKWSFAITLDGDRHIIPEALPLAENLVVVDLEQRAGVYVIRAGDAGELRRLLGSPSIRTVVRHTGPDVDEELERMLTAIRGLVERRQAALRGEDDGYGR
ncbi:hypothetical protein [Devosia sp. MC521]|uniref:hypothetical protein n=1 Tax=Devosia sp. MC521 TaxID=2759954 RepID=UPI0015FB2AE5|nr:hypothetical protein [Devosia sp. MC521]MBJ6986043.1 hypothetical protein [Devosia sp. MC521]QMW61413.1 hypothetical protein H4N61_10505 [Devosia sp. MC521]